MKKEIDEKIYAAMQEFNFSLLKSLLDKHCTRQESIIYLEDALLEWDLNVKTFQNSDVFCYYVSEPFEDLEQDFRKNCERLKSHHENQLNLGTKYPITTSEFKPIQLEPETKNNTNQELNKIRLELTPTEIVYLFNCLIEGDFIKLNHNPKIWHLITQYFVDKENKPIKNIHQIKDNLSNTKTGRPKNLANEIDKAIKKAKGK